MICFHGKPGSYQLPEEVKELWLMNEIEVTFLSCSCSFPHSMFIFTTIPYYPSFIFHCYLWLLPLPSPLPRVSLPARGLSFVVSLIWRLITFLQVAGQGFSQLDLVIAGLHRCPLCLLRHCLVYCYPLFQLKWLVWVPDILKTVCKFTLLFIILIYHTISLPVWSSVLTLVALAIYKLIWNINPVYVLLCVGFGMIILEFKGRYAGGNMAGCFWGFMLFASGFTCLGILFVFH